MHGKESQANAEGKAKVAELSQQIGKPQLELTSIKNGTAPTRMIDERCLIQATASVRQAAIVSFLR